MKTVLVPIDFSEATPRVLAAATAQARAFGARLVLLHVIEPEPDFVGFEPGPAAVRVAAARDAERDLAKLEAAREQVAREVAVEARQVQGPIVDKIVEEARQHGAELIVLGSHGHGALFELLVGSVTSGVLRQAACPVLVVPAR
jgi:nucleotide-binding universal stress UspA family protein